MKSFKAVVQYKAFPHAGPYEAIEVEVEAETKEAALEDLFRAFNHAIPGVTGELAEKHEVRSMSVGDEVKLDGVNYVCAGIGWVNLDENPNIVEEDFLIKSSRYNPNAA